MKAKYSFCSLLCLTLFLLCMTGCGKQSAVEQIEQEPAKEVAQMVEVETAVPEETKETDVLSEEAASTEEEATEVPVEEEILDPYVIAVDTTYGKLYYQEQWAEFMKVEQTTEGDILLVHFYAEVNGANYPLFTLSIGGGDGDPAAVLTDADGVQRDVYVIIEEIMEQDSFSEEEQNRLYAMQEEINYVMQNIK